MNEVVELLKQNQERAIDDVVASIIELVPRYAIANPAEVRTNVEGLYAIFLKVIETDETSQLTAALRALADKRVSQGFTAADFLAALMTMYPVVRNVVRAAGPRNDAVFAHMFARVEKAIFGIVASAANIYSAAITRTVEERAGELERVAEDLQEKERALLEQNKEQKRALQAAQDFNSRVIASLSSGVAVVQDTTTLLLLWSPRMAEITGIPESEALGRPVAELAARLKGVPVTELLATVRTTDRLPLTRVQFEGQGGQKRSIFIRGERLRGADRKVTGAVIIVDDITERELLIDSFSRYVSREVVQRLLSRSDRTHKLDGERRTCSVLFADIRGFTGVSERVTLEQLHELLNQYFRVMIDHVAAHDGIIDKFIGDKIMAVFTGGQTQGALEACRAAVGIRDAITALNEERLKASIEPIEVGIGVNTGEVVMGTVGSEERMSFTVIGDSVNVADRLQSLAGPGEVYVGAHTLAQLGSAFEVEELGARSIKGRASREVIYKLLKATT